MFPVFGDLYLAKLQSFVKEIQSFNGEKSGLKLSFLLNPKLAGSLNVAEKTLKPLNSLYPRSGSTDYTSSKPRLDL